jgi:signal transduction histidine kinase
MDKTEKGNMMEEKEWILIVNDGESKGGAVSNMVSQIGYETAVAKNAEEALEILKKTRSSLVIIDIKMPEEGFGLIKSVKAEFPDTYFICVTGPEASDIRTRLVALETVDTISRPFAIEDMRTKLSRVIRERDLIGSMNQNLLELGRANEELKRLDTLKSIFISSISHELRTPLTVIKEFISLMLDGHTGPLNEDQKEYLGITNKNVMRLTNLIETLLDFSRIESGKGMKLKFEPTPLIEVVEDASMTLSQQMEEKRITFENRIDPDTPLVLIDRNRTVEVFINLISNGIQFTPPDGKITIDSRGLTEKRDYLKVVVTDSGAGISPEDLPRIFDRFYQGQRTQTGHTTGTGLGLAITKEIIEGHQGDIHAESKFGSGASFVFTLPVFGIDTIASLLLIPMLEEAERDKMSFSLIRVDFWDSRTKREMVLSHESWGEVMYALQKLVRSVDTVIPFQNNVAYIFSFNDNKMAKEIGERVQVKLTQGGYLPRGTEVHFRIYSYPIDAHEKEEFLKGYHRFFKED